MGGCKKSRERESWRREAQAAVVKKKEKHAFVQKPEPEQFVPWVNNGKGRCRVEVLDVSYDSQHWWRMRDRSGEPRELVCRGWNGASHCLALQLMGLNGKAEIAGQEIVAGSAKVTCCREGLQAISERNGGRFSF